MRILKTLMAMVLVVGLIAGCCRQHKKDQPSKAGTSCCSGKTR